MDGKDNEKFASTFGGPRSKFGRLQTLLLNSHKKRLERVMVALYA